MDTDGIKPAFLDLKRLTHYLSMSKSTLQKLVREGKFPSPRQVTGTRRVGWLVSEVDAWLHTLGVSNLLPPPNTGAPKKRASKVKDDDIAA